MMAGNDAGTSSIGDQETDRSLGNEMDVGGPVILSVPTMMRGGDDDAGTNTDGGDSIYNPNYSIHSLVEVKINKFFQKKYFVFFFFFFRVLIKIIFNQVIILFYLLVNHRLVHLNQQQ
jgi:hypothetical protein